MTIVLRSESARVPVLLPPLARRAFMAIGFWLLAAVVCVLANAAEVIKRSFDLPADAIERSLKRYAEQSQLEILFPTDLVVGARTQPVRGDMHPLEALERMLAGTKFTSLRESSSGAITIIRRRETNAASAGNPYEISRNPTMTKAGLLARLGGAVALLFTPSLQAAADSGVIEGRVFSASREGYLEKAKVVLEGTEREVLTDETGFYRLTEVPAGPAILRVQYTGFPIQKRTVNVAAGQTIQNDITLTATGLVPGADGAPIKLSEFIVAGSSEMDGAAISINEQRFAPNIVNVVSADEFGAIAEGNLGDFMKFLPGMVINSVGGDARDVSMNGVPSGNVPISVGGFALASAITDGGAGRQVEFEQVSMNNLARVEVQHSPTPESPGSALAGSINLIPRSAFERAKPFFSGSFYLMMRDNDRSFHKTPGPMNDSERKVQPGLEFSYIVPVNRRFGFTLSGNQSKLYTAQDNSSRTWRGSSAATTGVVNGTGYPDTTPTNPYLTEFVFRDSTKFGERSSLGGTVDLKLSKYDRLSFAVQYAYFNQPSNNRIFTYNITGVLPGQFGPTFTQSAPGRGSLQMVNNAREKSGTTYMPTLTYRRNGPVWKSEAGLGLSRGTSRNRDIDKGYFNGTTSTRSGVTILFDEISYLRPHRIVVTEPTTGALVDPNSIASYTLASANSSTFDSVDVKRTGFANIARNFDLRRATLTLKGGLDVQKSTRDLRGSNPPFTFVGADGRATSTPADVLGSDDSAAVVFDEVFSQRSAAYGFGRVQWASNNKVWDLYRANPRYFTVNEATAHINEVNRSKHIEETISSMYLRGDLSLMERRLKFVGGLRAEQTNIDAEGPLNDPTRNYQRNASGQVVLDAAGRPIALPGTALEIARRTRIDRGAHAEKEYLRLFPSINASYNLRENLIARASYYQSVGRPNFNQYAGGITLPDTELAPAPNNRITVNNVGIKAWSAQTAKVRLEYYFEGVGQVSVGAFRREFENFFGSTVFPATPEFLALYSLDPSTYSGYEVTTQYNLTEQVRMSGLEFDYKQALTFLPHWARGLQVFANLSVLRATGEAADNFSGFAPRSASWGLSLTRQRYSLRANWSYRGRARGSEMSGRSIEPGTYNWNQEMLTLDLQGEFYLRKGFAIFASARNATAYYTDTEISGPNTPAYAQLRARQDFGALWTIGVKFRH